MLYSFVLCVWLTVLVRSLDSTQGVDTIWIFVVQIALVCLTLVSSLMLRPTMLLVFSLLSFLPLGLYLLGGEGLAKLGGFASFVGLVLSTAITFLYRREKSESIQLGS